MICPRTVTELQAIGLLRKHDVNFTGDAVLTMESFNASSKLKDDSDHEKGAEDRGRRVRGQRPSNKRIIIQDNFQSQG